MMGLLLSGFLARGCPGLGVGQSTVEDCPLRVALWVFSVCLRYSAADFHHSCHGTNYHFHSVSGNYYCKIEKV